MDDLTQINTGAPEDQDVSELGAWAEEFAFPRDLEALFTGDMTASEKVVAVRRALYRSVPVSVGVHVEDFHHLSDFPTLATALAAGDKGLWCAGVAFVFHRALESLGFRVWTIHFGFTDDLTHTANVVDVDGTLQFHDAYLNEKSSIDFHKMLATLQAGVLPNMHREARDKKIHIVPADYADRSEVEWYVDNSQMELPGVDQFRRFAIFPNVHRERVTYSWTGKGFERLRKLGLPEDFIFCVLNPLGVFDGRAFQADPARMPLYREWLQGSGKTLAQRLAEEEENLRKAGVSNEMLAVGEQLSALESDLRGDNASLKAAFTKANTAFQREWAVAEKQAQARSDAVQSSIEALGDGLAATLRQLHARVQALQTGLGALDGGVNATRAELFAFVQQEAEARREAEESAAAVREQASAREMEELSGLVIQVADELRALSRVSDRPAARLPFIAAVEALRDARKIAGELLAMRTREQLLISGKQQAEDERATLLAEVKHLSMLVNNSRYLRWRRRLKKLLTGRD